MKRFRWLLAILLVFFVSTQIGIKRGDAMSESDADFITTKPGFGRISEQFPAIGEDPLELGASLGMGRTWRRTGRVVYASGFEIAATDWWADPPPGGPVRRTTKFAHRGKACLEMIPPASNVASGFARRGPYIPTTRTGIELSLWPSLGSTSFRAVMYFHDGTDRYTASVLIDFVNQDIIIRAFVGGVPTDVKIGDLRYDWRDLNMNFRNIKLVANFETKTYEGLFIDNRMWDLSEHLMSLTPVANTYYIELLLLAWDVDENQSPVHVDDFIQTISEPEGLFKGA